MCITITIKQIKEILMYLEPHLAFVNCHIVDYFTQSLFELHIPAEIKQEIHVANHAELIDAIFRDEVTPINLSEFIKKTTSYSLYNLPVCLTLPQFQEQLSHLGCTNVTGLKHKTFMKPKKSHEVQVLSAIAASLKVLGNTTHIIDIGDGRGYLSSMLALHHRIPVLGVDSSLVNTTSAVKRVQKLERMTKATNTTLLYKHVTQYVSEGTDFKELVKDVFLEREPRLSVVGLHTCGNLAPASIKIYSENADVRTICNVGCCYHLLTETGEENTGFPVSRFLSERGFKLGRNARMLAAQSIDRILHGKKLPHRHIFYRAVLEVALQKHCREDTQIIGKLRQTSRCFLDYAHQAVRKMEINVNISDEELASLYDAYVTRENELYLFNLLRCTFSPVIESLILLDRLLYLQERGHENSFLVQLFDPVISPRCYGLIGYKCK